jgi:hypothetical protein
LRSKPICTANKQSERNAKRDADRDEMKQAQTQPTSHSCCDLFLHLLTNVTPWRTQSVERSVCPVLFSASKNSAREYLSAADNTLPGAELCEQSVQFSQRHSAMNHPLFVRAPCNRWNSSPGSPYMAE